MKEGLPNYQEVDIHQIDKNLESIVGSFPESLLGQTKIGMGWIEDQVKKPQAE